MSPKQSRKYPRPRSAGFVAPVRRNDRATPAGQTRGKLGVTNSLGQPVASGLMPGLAAASGALLKQFSDEKKKAGPLPKAGGKTYKPRSGKQASKSWYA